MIKALIENIDAAFLIRMYGISIFYLFTRVRILLFGFRYEHERMYIIYANKFSIQPHEKGKMRYGT